MKTLFRTIIVILAVNLITAGFAPAQDEQAESDRIEAETARAEVEVREAREKVEAEREQIEELKERIKELQVQTRDSRLVLPTPAPTPEIRIPGLGMMQSGSSGSILVIPSAQMSTEDILAMNEDMTVMSRILRQQLGNESKSSWMYGGRGWDFNFDPFWNRHRGMEEAIYLEGYGSLFLIKVDFPLSPPEQEAEEEEKETVQEDVDPVWEQTRRDIYEPQEDRERRRRTQEPEQKYDAEKVENLKASLIKALKHATNIRGLQRDESVILTIIGNEESSHTHTVIVSQKVTVNGKKSRVIGTPTSGEVGITSSTMLVIRAKKSDTDSFANDDINLEKFLERVQILTCPYLGDGASTASSVSISSTGRGGEGGLSMVGGRSSVRTRRGEREQR
jgi:hypothetical protein